MGFSFSWSTFFVETVNFLVLVWLLTRFFYQPVLRTIAAREAKIKAELSHAADSEAKAVALTQRYETRLADWESEKAQLRERFEEDLAALRARREAELKDTLERERLVAEAAARSRERDEQRRLWQRCADDATGFAARLLSRVASPALEESLVAAAAEDLGTLSVQNQTLLRSGMNGKATATIATRYALPPQARAHIAEALRTALGTTPALTFREDEALVAGIRIELGSATVDANLSSELRWFAQTERDAES